MFIGLSYSPCTYASQVGSSFVTFWLVAKNHGSRQQCPRFEEFPPEPYAAIPSCVTRPNRSMSAEAHLLETEALEFGTRDVLVPIQIQLLAPSKKSSRVSKFRMLNPLIEALERVQSAVTFTFAKSARNCTTDLN